MQRRKLTGADARHRQEWHYFFQNTKRWRNLRKITIAEVHGMVLSAGLMLAWCCDLIVAAEDTIFADVVGTRPDVRGWSTSGHPWSSGPQGQRNCCSPAIFGRRRCTPGHGRQGVPHRRTVRTHPGFAARIAKVPTIAAPADQGVGEPERRCHGLPNAPTSCFSLHQLNHSHWAELTGDPLGIGTVEYGLEDWRLAPEILPADKSRP